MCITNSVGYLGRNNYADVKVVQVLLNLNRHRYLKQTPALLVTDGLIGRNTINAIRRFETDVIKLDTSDGLITKGDETINSFMSSLPAGLSMDKLVAIIPNATAANIERYYQPLIDAMAVYEINTDLRMAHFLAQIAHESGSLAYDEEIASGEAYEGRADLGNTQPGDGKRFKGRGLIQLTGRNNYQQYSTATGIDYVSDPERLSSDPNAAVDVACWFWSTRRLNRYADTDDVRKVTRRINGGYNGLDDRMAFLDRAKCMLGV